MEEAAGVAFRTIAEMVLSLESVKVISFVLRDERALRIHEEMLARLQPGGQDGG